MQSAARKTEVPKLAAGTVIVLGEGVQIPPGIKSLAEFRRWTHSEDFPDQGRFSWIDGELRVDLSMEQAYSHNKVKTQFIRVLADLAESEGIGDVYSDGMRFIHPAADVSVEPDAFFISFDSVRSGRIEEVPGVAGGVIEFEGSPDMVLEIVSPSSEKQDTEDLRELYWEAGVTEYWLVDAREEEPRFQILKRGKKRYTAVKPHADGLRSQVFKRYFRLTRETNAVGKPQFRVIVTA